MKTFMRIFILLVLVMGLYGLQSCSSKNEVTGSLTITVMDQQGNIISGEVVSIATSLENAKNKVFVKTGYTDTAGSIMFRELAPQYYYFATEHYKGIGADKVSATVDQYVILIVEPLQDLKNPKN
jgi:hypothetical protein